MINLPNLLLIGGTNRNVGKTTLACKIIESFSDLGVVAIKISPHRHKIDNKCELLYNSKDIQVVVEQETESGKDSACMLFAGAKKVYYVQCADENLAEFIAFILSVIPDSTPIICESAGLRNVITPGCFLLLTGNKTIAKNQHLLALADLKLSQSEIPSRLGFQNGQWLF